MNQPAEGRSCPIHPSMGPYCSCPASRRVAGTGGSRPGGEQKPVPKHGFMKHMGYTVGKQGLPASERRTILRRCFASSVPVWFPEDYRDEWGLPETERRLRKMVDFLGGVMEWARARADWQTMQRAIEEWEADRTWLRTDMSSEARRVGLFQS